MGETGVPYCDENQESVVSRWCTPLGERKEVALKVGIDSSFGFHSLLTRLQHIGKNWGVRFIYRH